MKLIPNHPDPLQLTLSRQLKKDALLIAKEKEDPTNQDGQTIEEFVFGKEIDLFEVDTLTE